MKIRNYLDFINTEKIWPILRLFVKTQGEYTGRKVAYLTKLHHRTCAQYLEHLAETAILHKKNAGKAYMYSLKNNYFTKEIITPLIKKEGEWLYGKKQELNKLW